jgi:hypothetical protein
MKGVLDSTQTISYVQRRGQNVKGNSYLWKKEKSLPSRVTEEKAWEKTI